MILTGESICREVRRGRIRISPFTSAQCGPNSYDVRLSDRLLAYRKPILDMCFENDTRPRRIAEDGTILRPGEFYLGATVESVGSDHFVPCLEGRSSIGRLGIRIHATAGFGDLGFFGVWTLEIDVVRPVRVYPGVRIGQIFFHEVRATGSTLNLYNERKGSKYVQPSGPEASRLHKDFS